LRQEGVRAIGKIVIIALGGNAQSHAGNARATVTKALCVLRAEFPGLTPSELYETPAFPADSGPNYVNAACKFETNLSADAILTTLHRIEADFGRTRDLRWGQRTLDLDLIACGHDILPDRATQTHWRDLPIEAQIMQAPETLILPHPRVQDRAFVLVPMCDIVPDWVHPILGLSTREMLARRPAGERGGIKAL